MIFSDNSFKKLTLVSVAGYMFIFAIAAKGVSLYGSHHPQKDDLISFNGIIKKVKLGGEGRSTSFQIDVEGKTNRYSSYYGKLWPGMEHIKDGDRVNVLAERNKLSRGEIITGKQYYIWELIHHNRVIVAYEDVHELVRSKEQVLNQYINIFLYVSSILLIIAYIRKLYLRDKNNGIT
jgi:hypothetical protein